MRVLLPALEGLIQAGVGAGISPGEARRMAARVSEGTAALLLETQMSLDEVRALTPMSLLDEEAMASMVRGAAERASASAQKGQDAILTARLAPTR